MIDETEDHLYNNSKCTPKQHNVRETSKTFRIQNRQRAEIGSKDGSKTTSLEGISAKNVKDTLPPKEHYGMQEGAASSESGFPRLQVSLLDRYAADHYKLPRKWVFDWTNPRMSHIISLDNT